jgi:hypothetical protein
LQPDHEPLNQRPDHADDFVLPTAVRMIAHQSNTQCRDVGLIKSHQKTRGQIKRCIQKL